MNHFITINRATCKQCFLCSEVCPNKILTQNSVHELAIRQKRVETCFRCGQCMAVCTSQSIVVDTLSYEKDFFPLPKREYEHDRQSFYNLISSRRAIRNFKDEPVPKELLEQVIEAITFAPPSFPPLKPELIIIQDAQRIKQALPEMIRVYNTLLTMMKNSITRFFIKRELGGKRFKTLQHHLVPLLRHRMPFLKDGSEDTITRNAPAMILFLADRNGEDNNQDITIAATYGILAAHALGLGGSIMDIIPPAINHSKTLRQIFSIPDSHDVESSIILGYPKYKYQRGIRRSLKTIRWQ
ncbi:MAG TPA: nitroreductase family protein [Bacteroidota bacterium]|nr:nitroreductase family protein [Bacteroidota bacterium]